MKAAAARAPGPQPSCRMEEELTAPSTSADKTDSMDVDGEAKKLLGLGQKHLVLGDIPAAVNAFQEAASILGKKYGETADECAEAFFYYGKSLLELARMENGVLGNALEGVQVEEEEEKAEDDSMVENADNVDEETREELREQVYNAMGEKDVSKKSAEESSVLSEAGKEAGEDVEMGGKSREAAIADTEKKLTEKAEERVEADMQEKTVSEEEQAEVAVEKEAVADNPVIEAAEKQAEAGIEEKKAVALATEEQADGYVEEKAVALATEEQADGDVEEKAVALATEEQADGDVEEKAVALATEEQADGDVEEKAVVLAREEMLKSKEVLASKETLLAAGNATTPAEGKESTNEMQSEEKVEVKVEVAVKVEKERHDLMEEGDGDKVEKEEEREDLMEEGEETEGSDEEDKENDKTEDDKENDSTIEEKSFQESEEDEVGNLELAWDMLELAKVIYKRQETKEAQLHAAQAHLKLGEVSIESENYAQAIEEFQACLALQQKYLDSHDRLLAESHYQLALAYHYNSQFDEAILQFSKSLEVIDKRMMMLTERIKKTDGGATEDEKEIEELKGLLPEIKEKIEDSKESQKSARVAELALKATLVGGTTSGFTQSEESCSVSTVSVRKPTDGASQCVTDISHLVRKKTEKRPQMESGAAVENTV
ncbi:nuclear autoantigenic sperm protein isoform X2 [Pelodiscus sinensis]|uniref:nuclear autoantigenic sperm protein isoform X2 n=1 Tax=Pelodiscus sinensis TaxID=13735 RepID=UPI003F6AD8ED